MKLLNVLLRLLLTFLQTILFDWILELIRVIQDLIKRCRSRKREQVLPKRFRKTSRNPCVPLSDPAYKRPDPMIYSQYYLMKQGLAVTWNNTDIEVRKNNVPVPSHELELNTDYEIVARIWNNSTEAPVVGLPVQFSYMNFGVGTQTINLGQTHINLGVKGGADHPSFATMPWKTPAQAGHYCIKVQFEWLDDVNPENNLGQENTDVGIAQSPAEFDFLLRNETRQKQAFRFEEDVYEIPELDPCEQKKPEEKPLPPPRQVAGTINHVPAKHDRKNYLLPDGWSVDYEPAAPVLEPGTETNIRVNIHPPDSFSGRQAVNVNAFHARGLAGGVTLFVERS